MPDSTRERHPGWPGYVRRVGERRTFVIERFIGGTKFHVSTRCGSLRAAMKQLEEFEVDPAGYVNRMKGRAPTRASAAGRVLLTAALILEYQRWMTTRERPATSEWATLSAYYLSRWADDLAGLDLRDVSLHRHLKPALDRGRCRQHRAEVIKSFYKWLRREKALINHAEDPTVDLPIPRPRPEKLRRRKVVPKEHVLRVLSVLREDVADVLRLQLGTAWHISEVRRFATEGEIVRPIGGNPLAVLVVKHKSGELHSTAIDFPEYMAAAERILARGEIPGRERLVSVMKLACETARVPQFRLGQMRHTVLTWGVEMGATPQEASEFAGHKSVATTRKWYLDIAVPATRIPVIRLDR